MSLFNPYAFTPFGQPATPGVSALRAIGAPANAAQLAAARKVFGSFCTQTQLSAAPNQTAIGRLPDGTQYKIAVVGAMTTMTLWPTKSDAAYTQSNVYIGGSPFNGSIDASVPVTVFSFRLNGGSVSCEVKSFTPFADDHPNWSRIICYMYGSSDYVYFFGMHHSGKIGVFGRTDYFFLADGSGIVRGDEILKAQTVYGTSFAREYAGLGYVAFSVTDTEILQDDGTPVFKAPEGDVVTSVSFHPTTAKVSFIQLHAPAGSGGFSHSIVSGFLEPILLRGTNQATAYAPRLQLSSFPTYLRTKKELVRIPSGAWVEESSEPLAQDAVPSSVSFDADFDDYYLRRVKNVEGLVNYSKDTSFLSYSTPTGYYGGGTCAIEGSYRHAEENPLWIFGSAGIGHKIVYGADKKCDFSAFKSYHYGRQFNPFETSLSATIDSKAWVEIAGERIYTLDAQVGWSMTSKAVQSVRDGTAYAYYGSNTGSANLSVKCQRRELICYDPDKNFLCYIEEQRFEYLWEPSASCEFMQEGNGDQSKPYEGVPLDGENDMVPVGQPVHYLVMKIGSKEVLREKLRPSSDPELIYRARAEMIPATSVFLQPEVDEFPPEMINVAEYERRIRVLLCTGYQFHADAIVIDGKGGPVEVREHRFGVGPYKEGKRLDDYFLRLGAFTTVPRLEAKYITDSITLSGVLLLSGGVFELTKSAYVVGADSIEKHEIPEFNNSNSLWAT